MHSVTHSPSALVSVSGDLDAESSGQFRDCLLGLAETFQGAFLALDVSDLGLVDEHGLGILEEAHRTLQARGRGLLLTNVPLALGGTLRGVGATGGSRQRPAEAGHPADDGRVSLAVVIPLSRST